MHLTQSCTTLKLEGVQWGELGTGVLLHVGVYATVVSLLSASHCGRYLEYLSGTWQFCQHEAFRLDVIVASFLPNEFHVGGWVGGGGGGATSYSHKNLGF